MTPSLKQTLVALAFLSLACGHSVSSNPSAPGGPLTGKMRTTAHAIQHVFIILEENANWSTVKGDSSMPYLNGTLLKDGAYCSNYVNLPGIHPSEPNYLWLEAGTNFGILDDNNPSSNHQSSTAHLVNLLEKAGFTWKAYEEDIDGKTCPLTTVNKYAPKHDPFVFFDDVTDTNSTTAARCLQHVRPYTELASDIAAGTLPDYSFITPNLCDDMHDCSGATADAWLQKQLPPIMASSAYKSGAIFITWDESENGDNPIGMIVLSPFARAGYSSSIAYSHSSTLRTFQEIFGVNQTYLGDAANATDLSDLFTQFP